MKNDIIIFFDNTNDYAKYDEAKQNVFNSFADSQGWTDISEVPNDMVWEEISAQNEADWKYFSNHLKKLLQEHYYLITGTCGRWNGPAECGNFIKDYDDFTEFIKHLDNLKIYELNGHLYISGYHHDGHDSYEMKRLTDRGVQYADRHCFAHDKYLHSRIMKCNFYSVLPRLAQEIYGKYYETHHQKVCGTYPRRACRHIYRFERRIPTRRR